MVEPLRKCEGVPRRNGVGTLKGVAKHRTVDEGGESRVIENLLSVGECVPEHIATKIGTEVGFVGTPPNVVGENTGHGCAEHISRPSVVQLESPRQPDAHFDEANVIEGVPVLHSSPCAEVIHFFKHKGETVVFPPKRFLMHVSICAGQRLRRCVRFSTRVVGKVGVHEARIRRPRGAASKQVPRGCSTLREAGLED